MLKVAYTLVAGVYHPNIPICGKKERKKQRREKDKEERKKGRKEGGKGRERERKKSVGRKEKSCLYLVDYGRKLTCLGVRLFLRS